MAKVTFHQYLEAIRGKIDRLILRRRPDGTVILSRAPERYKRKKRRFSPAQLAHQERMKQAAAYATEADDIYPIYTELARAGSDRWLSPYNMALKDFLQPPVIKRIERGDGCIRVEATDNVGVTKVRVTVLDEGGAVLESGDAALSGQNWWEFASHAPGKTVIAEAWDLPGNVAKLEAPSVPAGTSPPNAGER